MRGAPGDSGVSVAQETSLCGRDSVELDKMDDLSAITTDSAESMLFHVQFAAYPCYYVHGSSIKTQTRPRRDPNNRREKEKGATRAAQRRLLEGRRERGDKKADAPSTNA